MDLAPAGAAAGVGFPGRLVEGLGLHGQSLALVHQVVQLLAPLQHRLNSVMLQYEENIP